MAYELGRAGLGGLYEGLHHHPGMSMHGASPAAAGLGVAQATSSKGEGHPPGWMCPDVPGVGHPTLRHRGIDAVTPGWDDAPHCSLRPPSPPPPGTELLLPSSSRPGPDGH